MKKISTILSFLTFFSFGIAQATPPIEGDVLEGNHLVVGANISAMGIGRKDNLGAPILIGNPNINGQYISLPTYSKDKIKSDQFDALLNLNVRYGILDYVEVFGNANGYYQASNTHYTDTHINEMNFAGANIGAMLTVYKGETFRVAIGDNSDIVNNAIFDDNSSSLNFFKGHTFMLNLTRIKEADGKIGSYTAQFYYRLNLTQKHKDESFKNGDEAGVKYLWQLGKDNKMGYFGANVAFRSSDKINGVYTGHKDNFDGLGVGFSTGGKYDINSHLGYKIDFTFMAYGMEYNAVYSGITFGLYLK
ncbi:hypothetical protein [Helicobacter sp. 13S00477-4]|uniref:hypothetical protein n=1 Tax=Helicobacter sp. 13S00477-4 TaxID=1905759 RepID=UPI000BA733BE|nr:hypothetical protein [Helicobacter sp. 13S00477-4]PAF52145.1 hypothetical protein BKH44_03320 [Helicobacter sp. 13S00477-4]